MDWVFYGDLIGRAPKKNRGLFPVAAFCGD